MYSHKFGQDVKIYLGDCLAVLPDLPTQSVDLVLCDPPYGTTVCKWDKVLDFNLMWSEINRICKPNAAIVLTASQPFTSLLIYSNIKKFKCEWIWQKNRGSNPGATRYQPMKEHESVLVFSPTGKPVSYYPIKQPRSGAGLARVQYTFTSHDARDTNDCVSGGKISGRYKKSRIGDLRIPSSIQKFNTEVGKHPTQKPVALLEYFIKTYSQPGELVLDFTMGSGSTGVAAVNTGRRFLGIELEEKYFDIASERIQAAQAIEYL